MLKKGLRQSIPHSAIYSSEIKAVFSKHHVTISMERLNKNIPSTYCHRVFFSRQLPSSYFQERTTVCLAARGLQRH